MDTVGCYGYSRLPWIQQVTMDTIKLTRNIAKGIIQNVKIPLKQTREKLLLVYRVILTPMSNIWLTGL